MFRRSVLDLEYKLLKLLNRKEVFKCKTVPLLFPGSVKVALQNLDLSVGVRFLSGELLLQMIVPIKKVKGL